MKRKRAAIILTAALLATATLSAETLTTADGKEHEVTVVRVTPVGVTVKTTGGEKTHAFDELDAACAYGYMRRTVDLESASGRITLAKYCLKRGRIEQAKTELLQAKRLDPGRDNEIDQIWAESAGARERPVPSPEQRERILAEQRSRGARAETILGVKVHTLETEQFIIHTTFPKGDHELLKGLCEKLYRGFDDVFDVTASKDRMWDGKCVMYFLTDHARFVRFAQQMHRYPGRHSGGYFRAQGGQCEVVIPRVQDLARFKETMVHETAHAFLHFYREPGRIPAWVHEGVAQYFQFSEFPKSTMLRRVRRTIARNVKSGRVLKLKTLAASRRPGAGDHEGYAYAYSYVAFMIRSKPTQFRKFIGGLKSGFDAETSLQQAYAWDVDALQKRWNRSVSRRR